MATATRLSTESLLNEIQAQMQAISKSATELVPMIQKHDETAQDSEKLDPHCSKLAEKTASVFAQLNRAFEENDSGLTAIKEQYKTTVEALKTEFPLIDTEGKPKTDLDSSVDPTEVSRQADEWKKKKEFTKEQCDKKGEEVIKILGDILKGSSTELNDVQIQLTEIKDRCIQQLSKAPPTNTSTYQHPITYITVKCNAGYGNSLSICGTGPQMSWDAQKALPLRCVGDDTWVYETTANFQEFEYKILLNNQWETGEIGDNHIVHRDNPQQITPRFS